MKCQLGSLVGRVVRRVRLWTKWMECGSRNWKRNCQIFALGPAEMIAAMVYVGGGLTTDVDVVPLPLSVRQTLRERFAVCEVQTANG
jgi:hypothetical protein